MSERLFFSIIIALALGGCADKGTSNRPKVVPAGGRVLFNGQPLAGAHVTFTNAAAGRSAYAKTDADGKFTLTTFERNDGAVPGKQQISVSKLEGAKPAEPGVDRTTTTNAAPAAARRWVIPRRYGDMTTSELTADIVETATNDLVVELRGTADE
jgi:hypothetical protein